MSDSSRLASSPLASHGKRRCVQIGAHSAANVARAAAQFGVTQRLVLDELLGDERVVSWAAREVAKRIGGSAAGRFAGAAPAGGFEAASDGTGPDPDAQSPRVISERP